MRIVTEEQLGPGGVYTTDHSVDSLPFLVVSADGESYTWTWLHEWRVYTTSVDGLRYVELCPPPDVTARSSPSRGSAPTG